MSAIPKERKGKTYIESLASQTVEKWPQLGEIGEIGAGREKRKGKTHPSFLRMVYLPSLNRSEGFTWR